MLILDHFVAELDTVRDFIDIELIVVRESDDAFFVKDEEGVSPQWISKSDLVQQDSFLVPGSICRFSIDETTAFERGYI